MAGERGEDGGAQQRASVVGDAYIAGRDVHIHLGPAGGVPSSGERDLASLGPAFSIRMASGVPAVWNVPLRLSTFTGRSGMLDDIELALRAAQPSLSNWCESVRRGQWPLGVAGWLLVVLCV